MKDKKKDGRTSIRVRFKGANMLYGEHHYAVWVYPNDVCDEQLKHDLVCWASSWTDNLNIVVLDFERLQETA